MDSLAQSPTRKTAAGARRSCPTTAWERKSAGVRADSHASTTWRMPTAAGYSSLSCDAGRCSGVWVLASRRRERLRPLWIWAFKVRAASGVFMTADIVTRGLSETDCYKKLEVISRKRLEREQISPVARYVVKKANEPNRNCDRVRVEAAERVARCSHGRRQRSPWPRPRAWAEASRVPGGTSFGARRPTLRGTNEGSMPA